MGYKNIIGFYTPFKLLKFNTLKRSYRTSQSTITADFYESI